MCWWASRHLHSHPRCAVVCSLTLCSSPCSFPCVSPISSSSWTWTCTPFSSMWLSSEQHTTGTPPIEESGPLVNSAPLTGYKPNFFDDYTSQRPLKFSSRSLPGTPGPRTCTTRRPVEWSFISNVRENPCRDSENEQTRILLERQKDQVLADFRAEIQKHEFQADFLQKKYPKIEWSYRVSTRWD